MPAVMQGWAASHTTPAGGTLKHQAAPDQESVKGDGASPMGCQASLGRLPTTAIQVLLPVE